MANEPNNPEEQLKDYAAQRRQLVPQQIHPATRNLLQGEVARTYGAAERTPRAGLRLRWLSALATLAVLAAIPLFLMPRSPETKNSKESRPTSAEEVTLPTAAKSGEAQIELSDAKKTIAPPPSPTASEPLASAASAPIVAADSVREEATAPNRAMNMQRVRSVETLTKTEARKTMKDIEASAAATVEPVSRNQKLSFVNNATDPQVLKRFEIQQIGQTVRITDIDDKSVYAGLSTTNGVINAAGINRTFKQPLTFTGQVLRTSLSTANQQRPVQTLNATANNNNSGAQNQSYFNNASVNANVNSEDVRLQGQAKIGNSQYQVDAQAAPAQ